MLLTRIMPAMWLREMRQDQAMTGKENGDWNEKKGKGKVDLIELCFPGLQEKCAPEMADQAGNVICVLEKVGHMFGMFAVGLEAVVRPRLQTPDPASDREGISKR